MSPPREHEALPGDPRLAVAPSLPPPPLDPAMLAMLERLEPVHTRRPWRAAAIVALLGALVPAAAIASFGVRRDLHALPLAWVIAMAIIWSGGAVAALVTAMVPRKGEVLPDSARAGRTAAVVMTTLIALGLIATMDAPPATLMPESSFAGFRRFYWGCTKASLEFAIPLMVIGGVLMRRLLPMGSARVATALGTAAGAIGGLTLHFICPVGGGLHAGLVHGGAVVIAAAIGFVFLPRLLRH